MGLRVNSESAGVSVTQTDLLFCRLDAVHAPVEFINFSSDRSIYRLALFSHRVMRVLDRERERERKETDTDLFN